MYTTSSHFRIPCFRKRILVWMMLLVFSSAFVPAISLSQQPTATTAKADIIETIQRFLQQLGYNPGPIDGKMGEKTRIAIRAFQRDHNLQINGEASMSLVEALTQATLTQAKRQEQDKERQPTPAELTTMSPNELYVRAIRFEVQGDFENAQKYYQHLIETYPAHKLAVKSADRIAIISTSIPQRTPTPIPPLAPTLTPPPSPTPIWSPKPGTSLTSQLEQLEQALSKNLKKYEELITQEQDERGDSQDQIIPVLKEIIELLRTLEMLYEQSQQPEMLQTIERVKNTRSKFEQKLLERTQQ
jgi:peptidoglycan hydrolase-like protein with peptidoglycan-binding domain